MVACIGLSTLLSKVSSILNYVSLCYATGTLRYMKLELTDKGSVCPWKLKYNTCSTINSTRMTLITMSFLRYLICVTVTKTRGWWFNSHLPCVRVVAGEDLILSLLTQL